jgi:hypothetical protein
MDGHLYRNNRDGTFTEVTEKAGLIHRGWACGVCVGDYDNDGFEDLFVTCWGRNILYHNNGDGTFSDVTAKAGLAESAGRWGTGCTFVDYNRDGWLDLFVSNRVVAGNKAQLPMARCRRQLRTARPGGWRPQPLQEYGQWHFQGCKRIFGS